jgi:lysozyme
VTTLRDQLASEEGRSNTAYRDTLGVWTIGIGHAGQDVYPGLTWTDAQIDAAFDKDVLEKTAQVSQALPWFSALNDPRQAVLLQMAFQMGTVGLLKFAKTLQAVHDGRWQDASQGMLNSVWASQTPRRAARLAQQMLTGEWIDETR